MKHWPTYSNAVYLIISSGRWQRITDASTGIWVKQGFMGMVNSSDVWTASFPMQW